jgi:hypothetical protein
MWLIWHDADVVPTFLPGVFPAKQGAIHAEDEKERVPGRTWRKKTHQADRTSSVGAVSASVPSLSSLQRLLLVLFSY